MREKAALDERFFARVNPGIAAAKLEIQASENWMAATSTWGLDPTAERDGRYD